MGLEVEHLQGASLLQLTDSLISQSDQVFALPSATTETRLMFYGFHFRFATSWDGCPTVLEVPALEQLAIRRQGCGRLVNM